MKKFLIGCGVLTGLAVLVLAGASFFAVRWFKENAADLQRVEELENTMVERFGNPVDFVPPVDGVYEADRVRLYVDLREDLQGLSAPLRERVDAELRGEGEPTEGIGGWFRAIKKGTSYFQDFFAYLADADSVLLENDMGRGEYVHLTGLLVRGALEVDATALVPSEVPKNDRGAFEQILVEFERETRDAVIDQWRNVLVDTAAEGDSSEQGLRWRERVEEQLALVRRERTPWPFHGEELPPSLAAVFDDVEGRLRATRPRSGGDLLLDDLLGAEMDDDSGGFQIRFGD